MSQTKTPRPFAGRILTIAGTSIVAAGVAFLVNIISARALGPEYRGHVATVLQLSYLIAPLIGFGADRALLRANDTDKPEKYVLPNLLAVLLMGAVSALLIFPIYGPWALLAIPTALVTVAFSFYRSVAIQSGSIRRYIAAFMLYQVSIMLGTVLLLLLEAEPWQWWAGVYIFPGILFAYFSQYQVLRSTHLRRAGVRTALRRNAALLWASLSRLIATRLNRVILPVIAGANSLGLFIVVATATEPLYWLAQSLADHQTSSSSGRRHSRASLLISLAKGASIFVPVAIFSGIVLYLLLVPLFGAEYRSALPLVLPLTLASIALASFRQISGLLLASSDPDSVGKAEGFAALSAVIIYPMAIYLWGAEGAAWGSIVVYAVGLIVGIIRYPTSK